jgi:hypothetical protein
VPDAGRAGATQAQAQRDRVGANEIFSGRRRGGLTRSVIKLRVGVSFVRSSPFTKVPTLYPPRRRSRFDRGRHPICRRRPRLGSAPLPEPEKRLSVHSTAFFFSVTTLRLRPYLPTSCLLQGNEQHDTGYPQPLPLNFSPYITFSPYFFISRSGSP